MLNVSNAMDHIIKKDYDKLKQKEANSVVLYSSFAVHENTSELTTAYDQQWWFINE